MTYTLLEKIIHCTGCVSAVGAHKCNHRVDYACKMRSVKLTFCNYRIWIRFQDCGCVELREINFLIFADRFDCSTFVHANYFNTDMCKFESLQFEESRAQSAECSKPCSKPRAFICCCWWNHDVCFKQVVTSTYRDREYHFAEPVLTVSLFFEEHPQKLLWNYYYCYFHLFWTI